MRSTIRVISSMATRLLLLELAEAFAAAGGEPVRLESVGGIDAARRLAEGEAFDVAVLASGAIGKLESAGHIRAGSRVDLVRSPVAVAIQAGADHPDISTAEALRRAVQAAASIGYSTGPSGDALASLFAGWGIADEIAGRVRIPPPGVAVGSLLQSGEIAIGFQQLSELLPLDRINLLGPLPASIAIETIFSGGICAAAEAPQAAGRLLAFLKSAAAADAKRRHGMEPA